MKIAGTVGLIPAVAWFLPLPWQVVAGFFPPYWISKAMWVAADGGTTWPLYLGVGLISSLLVLRGLVRRFLETAR